MTIYKRLIMTTSPFILEYHDNDRDNHYQLIASVILTISHFHSLIGFFYKKSVFVNVVCICLVGHLFLH